jgi:hypothetical protein
VCSIEGALHLGAECGFLLGIYLGKKIMRLLSVFQEHCLPYAIEELSNLSDFDLG